MAADRLPLDKSAKSILGVLVVLLLALTLARSSGYHRTQAQTSFWEKQHCVSYLGWYSHDPLLGKEKYTEL